MLRIYVLVIFITLSWHPTNASVNLSLNKPTNQSSLYGAWTSNLAVDGCKQQQVNTHCCIHTSHLGFKEAWWQVNLQQEAVIENVLIYYRDGWEHRLGGYEIILSNTSEWAPGQYCYTDKTPTKCALPSIRNNTCQGIGQYVTIYVDRRIKLRSWYSTNAILELCEVEVYGCPPGQYGNGNCYLTCDASCVDGICNPSTGTCLRCGPGYYKDGRRCSACQHCLGDCDMESGACSECPDGTFGDLCVTCPSTCNGGQCKRTGGYCKKGCVTGKFGAYCDKTCPMDCRNHVCEQTAGTCAGCTPGKYGFTCEETCPACCPGKRCLQADGMCEDLPITGSKEDCLVVKVIFPVLLAFVTALCLLIVIRIKQKYSPTSRLAKRKEPFSSDNTTMEMDQHNVYSNAGVVMD